MDANPGGFSVDALLCDSAATAEGKLFIQGAGWNFLVASAFPFRAPRIGVGIVIGIPYTATNANHTLEMSLNNEDGNTVWIGSRPDDMDPDAAPAPLRAPFNVGRPPFLHPGDAQTLPLAVNIDGAEFQGPGGYSFKVTIDGELVKVLPFRVLSQVGQTLQAQR